MFTVRQLFSQVEMIWYDCLSVNKQSDVRLLNGIKEDKTYKSCQAYSLLYYSDVLKFALADAFREKKKRGRKHSAMTKQKFISEN